jgi:glutamate/tyrosine decarboxylase-like PLP-dependent enzyme
MAMKKLKQIYNSYKTEGATHKRNNHILDRIKHKLTTNNAIIAQADKKYGKATSTDARTVNKHDKNQTTKW